MMSKEDIFEYIEGASIKKIKQLAMTLTAMLNDTQLNIVDSRFTKKIDFDPILKQKPEPKKKMPFEPDIPPVPDKLDVSKDPMEDEADALADMDFDFGSEVDSMNLK